MTSTRLRFFALAVSVGVVGVVGAAGCGGSDEFESGTSSTSTTTSGSGGSSAGAGGNAATSTSSAGGSTATSSGTAGGGGASSGTAGGGGASTSSTGGAGGAGGAVIGSAPVATINHPGDGETRKANVDIPFIGVGTDAEDGALSGASLVWTDDKEGKLGIGASFSKALTVVGPHVVTLTVTDSDANTGTDSIALTIEP